MAELVEKETEAYYKKDPDPLDDRHPGRVDPMCALGHLLKAIAKNEDFETKVRFLETLTVKFSTADCLESSWGHLRKLMSTFIT